MELGFALPHLGPIATRDNIRQVAMEAERLGYHSLWTNERLLKPVNPKTPYPGNPEGVLDWQYETVFEHLTTLTYASAITERVRLGVSVLNLPFHIPTVVYMGLLLGEMFDLEALSAACADDGRYEMLVSAPPLPFTGTAGAPPGPVAVR